MTDKNEQTEIVPVETTMSLGALRVSGPTEVVTQATAIADALNRVINEKQLYSNIQGKKYVKAEGWATLGAMLGVTPREVSCTRLEDGGYEAIVELVRVSDQAVIGRGSALCGMDEKRWANGPEYARRSMSITRATGKAFRLAFAWIVTLAGYAGTPAEEMDFVEGQAEPIVEHWIDRDDVRKAFWRYSKDELRLNEDQVYLALEVDSIHKFEGTMSEAKQRLIDYADFLSNGTTDQDAA